MYFVVNRVENPTQLFPVDPHTRIGWDWATAMPGWTILSGWVVVKERFADSGFQGKLETPEPDQTGWRLET